ncbi:MAG: spermidine synthase [Patescibacteria group bacterium]
MDISKLFSKLIPKTIYEQDSPISGKIRVTKKGDEQRLEVNSVCQSVDPSTPDVGLRYWGQIAEQASQRLKDGGQALLLGVGGGTVAHLLTKRIPQLKIYGVELDPVIIAVAEKYFNLGSLTNLTLVQADALEVLEDLEKFSLPKEWQLIIVDLYCGGKFPAEVGGISFLRKVKHALAEDGWAIFNRVRHSLADHQLDEFLERVEKVFSGFEVVEVPGPSGFINVLVLVRV